jgi:DNA-binding NarL/FixJ family response regulator
MSNIVYLADDHAIVAHGIASLLQSMPIVSEVIIFNNGKQLYEAVENTEPQVIILDIEMPVWSGIDTLIKIKEKFNIPCIMLSMNDEKYIIQDCIKKGADAYLPKDCTMENLQEAIEMVLEGGTYIEDSIQKILATKKRDDNDVFELVAPITKRELEILTEISNGLTCKDIGEKLFLSTRTVETHKKSIMAKFDAHTIGKLVSLAYKHKFVK